jgi:hypothetical protein
MDKNIENLLCRSENMTQARDTALKFYEEDEEIKKTIDRLVGQLNLKLKMYNPLSVIVNLADISINKTLKTINPNASNRNSV